MNPLRPFTTAWGSFSSFPFFEKSEPLSFIIFRRVRYLNNRPNRSLFFFVRALLKVGQNQAQCQAPIDTTLTLCVTGWSLTIQKKKQHFLDVCVTSWPFGLVNADALLPNVFQSDSFLVFKWGERKMEENGATAVTECRRRATTPYRPHRSVFVADDAAKDIQTTSFFQFPTKFLSLKHVFHYLFTR